MIFAVQRGKRAGRMVFEIKRKEKFGLIVAFLQNITKFTTQKISLFIILVINRLEFLFYKKTQLFLGNLPFCNRVYETGLYLCKCFQKGSAFRKQ